MTPVRVLHLVDIQPGTDGRCLHRLVHRTIDGLQARGEHVLLEVGGGARRQPCLPPTSGRLNQTRLVSGLSGQPLWRVLEAWADAGHPIDLIHCWGDASLRLRAACGGGPPTLCTLDSMEIDASLPVDLIELSHLVPLELQVGSSGMADALRAYGLEVGVAPFGFDIERSEMDPDRRRAWGAGDETLVFGMIGDRLPRASLRSLIGVPVRLAVAGGDVRVVAPEWTGGFEDGLRWLDDMDRGQLLVREDVTQGGISSIGCALAQGTTDRCGEIVGLIPILEALAASRPVLLGRGHPAAAELAATGAVFAGVDDAESDAARWLREGSARRVDAGGLLVDMTTWCEGLLERYALLAE